LETPPQRLVEWIRKLILRRNWRRVWTRSCEPHSQLKQALEGHRVFSVASVVKPSSSSNQTVKQPHWQAHDIEILTSDLFDKERTVTLNRVSAGFVHWLGRSNVPVDFLVAHLGVSDVGVCVGNL